MNGDMDNYFIIDDLDPMVYEDSQGKIPLLYMPPSAVKEFQERTGCKPGDLKMVYEDELNDFNQSQRNAQIESGNAIAAATRRRVTAVDKRLQNRMQNSKPVVTDEDIKRAAEAEKELLRELEEDERSQSMNKNTKLKDNTNKKKKKK